MVRYAYYSIDPDDFNQQGSQGCGVGETDVRSMSGGLDYMACIGAEELGLPPGRYAAIQVASDRSDTVIGFGWIVEVMKPTTRKARIVK